MAERCIDEAAAGGQTRAGLTSGRRLMTEYRASFDATIRFSNGGDLTAHGFRVDVPSPDMDQDGIAALFVASLGLLMTDSVTLTKVEIFAEPHKGTRGGPSDHRRGGRPAHTVLLAAGIPVVEHLTGLGQLPATGAWFSAVPLRIEKLGTIPVRAFARLPG